MRSVIGCLSTAIFIPLGGSRAFGAVMSTPGIGPATAGLSGFELLVASHADATSATTATNMAYAGFWFIDAHTATQLGYRIEESGSLEAGWEPGSPFRALRRLLRVESLGDAQ